MYRVPTSFFQCVNCGFFGLFRLQCRILTFVCWSHQNTCFAAQVKNWSTKNIKDEESVTISSTAADSLTNCLRLGQTTFSNSSFNPWKKFVTLNPFLFSGTSASFFFATLVYPPYSIKLYFSLIYID
ncbi:hypothetical protein RintRC_5811 [Richelia intracellularis]|nr:hypothetical protein RintRC_5811 [Richelia intracellularis]